MKRRLQYAPFIALICGLLVGCAHLHQPIVFTQVALIAYRDAALKAATSPEEWQRFPEMRITTGPLELYTKDQDIHYAFHIDRQRVDVLILTKCKMETDIGPHLTTLRVTLDPGTALVLSMKEEKPW